MDAYRGLVMLLMMGEVLKFHRIAEARPDSWFWRVLAYHQTHVEWIGCSLHDRRRLRKSPNNWQRAEGRADSPASTPALRSR